MAVPLFDTRSPLEPLLPRLRERAAAVLEAGVYVLGPEVEGFERELAEYVGVRHAVGVGNGTDALTIALRALGVAPGDEVVVPSFTFYASAEAIPPTGAAPVFCDVDPDTFCVTPDTVRAALTPRTKAVIAVDLFGNVAPTPEIEAVVDVPVLVDAAQALGSRRGVGQRRGEGEGTSAAASAQAGSFGAAATVSFFPSKNLGGFGDGGAILTDDDELAERARTLRFHGSRDKVTYEAVGYNSRLDELQAALLRVLLPELDGWADGRRTAGRHYLDAGLGELVKPPTPTAGSEPAWHLYVIRHPLVDRLGPALDRVGIGQRAYYRTPVHRQPAMRDFAPAHDLPGTDEAAATHLAIPMNPRLDRINAIEVVSAIREARD